MLPSIFIEVRDFFYLWLTKSHGKAYAESEHRFRIGAFWYLYYIGLVILIAVILSSIFPFLNISASTSHFLKTNVVIKLVGALALSLPYYIWLKKYLFPQLNKVPINKDCDAQCYKRKMWKTVFTFLGSCVLIPIVGVLTNLMRFGHL